ncbi:MAG: hypothetical protein P8Y47_08400 [Alphaproteobacteria bacterium]
MNKISKLAVLACLCAGLAFAGAASAQTKATANVASAQQSASGKSDKKDSELSAKSTRLIMGFALTTIPSEIKQPNGKVLKIDRKDPKKILVPIDDARRIIMAARNSAHAQMCNMPELQSENYMALMRSEQAKNKWSQQQILFINRLHLFTVMWLTGNVKFLEKDGKKEPQVISEPDKGKKKACSEAEKAKVKKNIEAFLKLVQKS